MKPPIGRDTKLCMSLSARPGNAGSRLHNALYELCRDLSGRETSPTAAIIDSQSVKSAEKGGPRLTRQVMMQARRSRVRSGIFS